MKRFKICFEFETEEYSFNSSLEKDFKKLFPDWKNIKVEELKKEVLKK